MDYQIEQIVNRETSIASGARRRGETGIVTSRASGLLADEITVDVDQPELARIVDAVDALDDALDTAREMAREQGIARAERPAFVNAIPAVVAARAELETARTAYAAIVAAR
jgi:hypothetical protein